MERAESGKREGNVEGFNVRRVAWEKSLAKGQSVLTSLPVVAAILATLLFISVASAQNSSATNAPAKSFFLPKNPVAAAYMLGRLSNKELIEAPRSEFVYVALLQRKGLDRKYRVEALTGLAKIHQTDPLTELTAALRDLDKKGADSTEALRDLAPLLLQNKPEIIAAQRAQLDQLAEQAQLPITRQITFAALESADRSLDPNWRKHQDNPERLADVVLSIPWLRDPVIRAAAFEKLNPLLQRKEAGDLRRAAIVAVASVPGNESFVFKKLAGLVRDAQSGIDDRDRAAIIASLQKIPKKLQPVDEIEPLLAALMNWLPAVSPEARTEADFINALQFADELASSLPPEKGRPLQKTIRGLGPAVAVIRAIYEQMLFDKTLVVVEPGKTVQLILQNEDAMPHNLAVLAPGSIEEIGQAAEKMPPEPDAQGRTYVPDSPKVLQATPLVAPGQTARLVFTAPTEPGDYPYICSFPGHWRRMVGTLAVATDVDAYLASHAAAQPKITEWKLEDFDLSRAGTGRNLTKAKELFSKLACIQCHKLGKDGYAYGPDLTDVLARYKGDRAAVLDQILDPSKTIADRYRNYEFEMADGESLFGLIVKEDPESITIQTGPADTLIQTIQKPQIKGHRAQTSSLMPVGLLNTLSKEEILDLLAWIETGGAIPPHAHEH